MRHKAEFGYHSKRRLEGRGVTVREQQIRKAATAGLQELQACGNCGPQLRINCELRDRADCKQLEVANCGTGVGGHCGN